jgi:hypothetical protein
MAQLYRIVLIDDNVEYSKALVRRGAQLGFDIQAFTNLVSGFEAVKSDNKVNGIILDAHCPINEGMKPDFSFLAEAQHKLDELQSLHDRQIYSIINTGHYERVAEFFANGYDIVEKAKDNQDLLLKLRDGIAALDGASLRAKYETEIDILNTLFPSTDKEGELISILQRMNSQNLTEIGATLGKIRKLYESLIRLVTNEEAVPSNLSARSKILFLAGRECKDNSRHIHQNNQVVIPEYISNICFALWGLGSWGGHENRDLIPCTKHTAIGSTHLLLDLINWVGKWMDE